ncbi:MAG: lysyl-tRNA synthetase, partial [Polaromonas sp.]|nr:lysyl-tRNA synthetase [Polaromonas sp.]
MSSHPIPPAAGLAALAHHDENQLMVERREKLNILRRQQADGKGVAFPNDIKPSHRAEALFAQYSHLSNEELEPMAVKVSVAGRMMLKRVMGKASFATLQDASFGPTGGRIQLYINNAGVGEDVHAAFKHWDLGDIVAATGMLFRTKTGELSVNADSIRLVTKSLRPLPDKFHGMAD